MQYHTLVAYDICNSKRLQKVHRLMSSYGQPVQYSVFLCRLSERDAAALQEKIHDLIHHNEDQVILIRLAPVVKDIDFATKWTVLGKKLSADSKDKFIY